ncbi:fatty acid synthase-like [Plodia interpunctella]|uniref:fatty acid synthase-like n=1 Tax=Plodia interpunctella TaxID=58824 RepID=UPI002368AE1E|nr:fatty acid synthase-like [Plodia interpunctella]XP_053608165.1 fatty acid synthase-like [Plodia interpunctella]
MAPIPQENVAPDHTYVTLEKPVSPLKGDEIVISGMSGIFPSSSSVNQFKENLYNNVDMVCKAEPRWVFHHPEVSDYLGKVEGIEKFDAQFFKVHYKQALTMEPMSRVLLEHAYAAVYDAGVNPVELKGKRVGVFIGSAFSESEKIIIFEMIQRNGFGISGCNRAMYANRISYWMDSKGPSYALDVACASSMACLEHAYETISSGICDAAIVGGCNLCMHPHVSLNIRRAGFSCLDGKTRCFDNNADGAVRADAISVLYIQKAQDAKRIYSQVYHMKGNYATNPRVDGEEFLPTREPKEIEDFFNAFYSEINMDPTKVEFVEAYGSALKEADGNELEAIGKVFAKDKPIRIGSVKSNMGHSEPASGICQLVKANLAFQKGVIPANLHYSEPQNHIASVRDGKIQVVTENTPLDRNGFIAVNNFSYSGANIHVLLKGHYKPKDPERYKSSIPQLVLASGRLEPCVQIILDALKTHPIDPEEIGLLRSIHSMEIPGHLARGYIILDTNEKSETVVLSESAEYYPDTVNPVWFVYSGMGSQWAGMGAELMRIPIFAAAIEKCHKVLEPKGLDIVKILTDPDKTIYDNILNSFVGIAAVQIGLTDILTAMGIVPDNIIGHSVGELGCAYADGCFTAEEMILSAYSRGLVSVQTPFIKGSMAAVGLSYKAVLALCPPEIEVACHNSSDSSTISGPADVMKNFVAELTAKGIFAKEVPCSNIAYHSRYIAEAGPSLLKYLGEVIKDPKPRSEKWVSTSVPQDRWSEPLAKYSSAEYHTNNLLNSVLFEETSKLIPANATVVEIAPHGLLQAILKRSLKECNHIPLTRRGHSDPVKYLLEAIGKLYQAGLNPKVDVLYPKIEYPVSTETPLISHLVGWQHSDDWPIARYFGQDRIPSISRNFVMSVYDSDYSFMRSFIRDGQPVFPEAASLRLVWEVMAMYKGVDYRDMSVIFKNVQITGEANVTWEKPLTLSIGILKGNNRFEVSFNGKTIIEGTVYVPTAKDISFHNIDESKTVEQDIVLDSEDVYKIMDRRGFTFKDMFKSIVTLNSQKNKATVKASEGDEWVTFLDSLIQFHMITRDHDGVSKLKFIRKLTICVEKHKDAESKSVNGVAIYEANLVESHDLIQCGGVELEGVILTDIPKVEAEPDLLETRTFVPNFVAGDVDVSTALLVNLQIVGNNTKESSVKVAELINKSPVFSNIINFESKNIVDNDFAVQVVEVANSDLDDLANNEFVLESDLVVVNNLLTNDKKSKNLFNVLKNDAFVLSLEQDSNEMHSKKPNLFEVITTMYVKKQILILLKKTDKQQQKVYIKVNQESKFSWVPTLESELQKTKPIVLVSERQPFCGLIGLVKAYRKKFGDKISLLVVDDYNAPSFDPENTLYKEQLQKNLAFNILKKGQWGGYYYLPTSKSANLQNLTLVSKVAGDIDSLIWVEAPSLPSNTNLVQVYYADVSFKDVKTAIHKEIIHKNKFGMGFSGINSNGERVMGVVQGGALSSTIEADPDLTWPVPDHWSLEDAATVPVPFLMAFYCLGTRFGLRRGSSIFVNGGAGAVGQAIISIALSLKCNVFTNVSSDAKKKLLLKLFPELKENNIGDSRLDAFVSMVVKETNGHLCNLAINCASGPLREATMKVLGISSYLFDLNDYDMSQNKDLGMSFLRNERNYRAINLASIFMPQYLGEKQSLRFLMSEGIATGSVRPLTRVVYSPNDVTRAFRLLSRNSHRGKVLIRMKDPSGKQGVKVVPRMSYSSPGSYVVVVDENGLGIDLADHLVKRGARNLVIHIMPNNISGYFCSMLTAWKKLGVSVKLSSENLETPHGCINLFKEGCQLGVVSGIFFVQDTKMSENSELNFADNFNKSTLIVANLDLASRSHCPELSNFVVLSQLTANAASEFAAAATDKVCEARHELGLPALALRFASDQLQQFSSCFQSNVRPLSVHAVFNAMDTSLRLKHANMLTFDVQKQNSEYLTRIAKIIGDKIMNNNNDDITIGELNLNEVNIEEIRSVLEKFYKINHPSQAIMEMTLAQLKSVENNLQVSSTNFDGGLGAFLKFIDTDECLAAEPMVPLPTQSTNATEKEEELDPKASYLMLVPGFEGHHEVFRPICERLKIQAMILQLGPDLTDESIPQMAASIMKCLKKRFEFSTKFYLLGYSFGVNVALELAALIESEGHVGIVYCLDSSPDALRVQLDAYIGKMSDAELQNSIIEHIYRLMTGQDSKELSKILQKTDDWNQKIEWAVIRLKYLAKYSHEYKRTLMNTLYRRIVMSREYEPKFVLNSELVLLKGLPHPKAVELPDDYNLSKYTTQPVRIFNLQHDHALAPEDSRISNIINNLLDPSVLEEFKSRNLCDSYLADAYKIL